MLYRFDHLRAYGQQGVVSGLEDRRCDYRGYVAGDGWVGGPTPRYQSRPTASIRPGGDAQGGGLIVPHGLAGPALAYDLETLSLIQVKIDVLDRVHAAPADIEGGQRADSSRAAGPRRPAALKWHLGRGAGRRAPDSGAGQGVTNAITEQIDHDNHQNHPARDERSMRAGDESRAGFSIEPRSACGAETRGRERRAPPFQNHPTHRLKRL